MNENQEPDPELAAELRQAAGREWTEEAAEDERLTELLRRRKLTLADVVEDLAHRGDRVSVEFGGHTFSGVIKAAGSDYVSIDTSGQSAAIRLDTGRWSVLVHGQPAEPWPNAPETFRALLHQYAASDAVVRLSLPGGDMVIGTIAVVAVDHVEIDDVDQRRLFVPIEMVLGIIRSTDLQ